jgi:ElaB/YqjD/DUF883 family membrane-anchored ribosome-binding protein
MSYLFFSGTPLRAEFQTTPEELYSAASNKESATQVLLSGDAFILLPLSFVFVDGATDLLDEDGTGHLPAIVVDDETRVGHFAFESLMEEAVLAAGPGRRIIKWIIECVENVCTPRRVKDEYERRIRELDDTIEELCEANKNAKCEVKDLKRKLIDQLENQRKIIKDNEERAQIAFRRAHETAMCSIGARHASTNCAGQYAFFFACMKAWELGGGSHWSPAAIQRKWEEQFPDCRVTN